MQSSSLQPDVFRDCCCAETFYI